MLIGTSSGDPSDDRHLGPSGAIPFSASGPARFGMSFGRFGKWRAWFFRSTTQCKFLILSDCQLILTSFSLNSNLNGSGNECP